MRTEMDYDQSMGGPLARRYYGDSGFFNYGYWTPTTTSQREASENLVEKLLSYLPTKQGTILDVACGLGATTRHLLRYYPASAVTGINISEAQLAQARQRAPGCTFLLMDAVNLQFPDATFDAVICVEAAFHFNTRDQFLREAYRVLKPGGWLTLSDILSPQPTSRTQRRLHRVEANYVPDLDTYRQRLVAAGFAQPQVVDATEACWGGFKRHLQRWPREERAAGQLSWSEAWRARLGFRMVIATRQRALRYYVLAAAQK